MQKLLFENDSNSTQAIRPVVQTLTNFAYMIQKSNAALRCLSLLLWLLLTAGIHHASAQPDIFSVEEITISSSKRNVEEFVVHKVRDYFDSNTDNCWKIIKKKQGINLSKKPKRQQFLNALEDELRLRFPQLQTLSDINLYPKYGVFITSILGRHIKVHHFNRVPGKSNPAQLDIGFVNEKVSFFSANIRVVPAYDVWSGFPYNSDQVNRLINSFNKAGMSFKHSSYRGGTNACSEKEEPNYRETFSAYRKGVWNQSYTYNFGPYTQRINNYSCRYTGQNHLTDISIFIYNEKL